MNILPALQWRYATKRMTGQQVPQEKIDNILEAARLAPSSSGLQPFQILLVTDKQLLQKIQPIAYNQPQITEASHVLVFAAKADITEADIDAVYRQITTERNLPTDALKEYTDRLKGMFADKTREERFEAAARQAYIAFGFAIVAAAAQEVDSTPMEGFDNAALDRLLELDKKGLKSVTLLALGFRDTANDWLANLKKVRKSREELVAVL
jgi:nitroreductase/dihydropteridine reductase